MFLLDTRFWCAMIALGMIVLGVFMVQNEAGFWDIVEAELLLMVYGACLLATFACCGEVIEDFAYAKGSEKFAAILFIPLCAVGCVLGARYGGDLIYRGISALLNGTSIDLNQVFTMGGSILGEYPKSLYIIGAAMTPIAWPIISGPICRYRWWIPSLLGAALVGALGTLVWLVAAMLIVGAVVMVIVAVIAFIIKYFLVDEE